MATMKAKDVARIAQARVGDPSGMRFNGTPLIDAINDAVRQLCSDRPDARLSTAGALVTITDATGLESDLSVDDKFKARLAELVAERLVGTDAAEQSNRDRAAFHDATYKAGIR